MMAGCPQTDSKAWQLVVQLRKFCCRSCLAAAYPLLPLWLRLPLWPSLCLLASLPCSRLLRGVLLQSLLREVQMAAGRIILFIDELHLLMDAGRVEGGMNAGEFGTGHWLEPCAAVDESTAFGRPTVSQNSISLLV